MFLICITACEIRLLPDHSNDIQDQLSGLQQIIINAEPQIRITPLVITHSDPVAADFILNIERHGVSDFTVLRNGVPVPVWKFDYYADVPINIGGNEVYGLGHGPGTHTNEAGKNHQVCDFEMEYEVKGEFKGPPECALLITVHQNNLPGDCELTTPLATYHFDWPASAVGTETYGPYIFEFEIGQMVEDEYDTSKEVGGTIDWVSTYSLRSFTTVPPLLYDCDIDPDVYEFGEAAEAETTPDN